jgi:ribosomal protein L40E
LGEKDDERVIEIREGANEQVIQAQLRPINTGSQPSSQSGASEGVQSSILPSIVACTRCNSRFASGVKFCGRCGNGSFAVVNLTPSQSSAFMPCPRCGMSLPLGAKFCGRCGLQMQQTQQLHQSQPPNIPKPVERICQRCQTPHPQNSRFCGKCGLNFV